MNKHEVEHYLEAEPRFRERRHKDRGIVNLLQRKYPVLADIPKDTLIEAIHDAHNADRYWRLVLADREDLRGSDYGTKRKVEQEYQKSIGYEAGYASDIRLGKRL